MGAYLCEKDKNCFGKVGSGALWGDAVGISRCDSEITGRTFQSESTKCTKGTLEAEMCRDT